MPSSAMAATQSWQPNEGNIDPSEQQENMNRDILRADPQSDGSYTCQRMTFDTTGTNGLPVSPDERSLYIIQTYPSPDGVRELRSYPINDDGSLGQYIVLHQFGRDHRGPQRGIDGMCLDSEGNIVGTAGNNLSGPGPMIYVWTPRGRVLETYPMPVGVDGPHQLLFRRRRPGQPVRHHRPGTPAPAPQHRAPRLDHVAPGAVALQARQPPGMYTWVSPNRPLPSGERAGARSPLESKGPAPPAGPVGPPLWGHPGNCSETVGEHLIGSWEGRLWSCPTNLNNHSPQLL